MKRTSGKLKDSRALGDYANGYNAPLAATGAALAKAADARALILVEGISDQIALETLARRRGIDLSAQAIVVFPVGGSSSVARYLEQFGPMGEGKFLSGLCDADAVAIFARALSRTGFGQIESEADLAACGFYVCTRNLEEAMIRAVGPNAVEALIEAEGEIAPLRTLQKQAGWQDRPLADQILRFIRSRARRSLRYAAILIDACDSDKIPGPLDAVLVRATRNPAA